MNTGSKNKKLASTLLAMATFFSCNSTEALENKKSIIALVSILSAIPTIGAAGYLIYRKVNQDPLAKKAIESGYFKNYYEFERACRKYGTENVKYAVENKVGLNQAGIKRKEEEQQKWEIEQQIQAEKYRKEIEELEREEERERKEQKAREEREQKEKEINHKLMLLESVEAFNNDNLSQIFNFLAKSFDEITTGKSTLDATHRVLLRYFFSNYAGIARKVSVAFAEKNVLDQIIENKRFSKHKQKIVTKKHNIYKKVEDKNSFLIGFDTEHDNPKFEISILSDKKFKFSVFGIRQEFQCSDLKLQKEE